MDKILGMFFVARQGRHAEMRRKIYSTVSCPSRSPSIINNSSINNSAKRLGFPNETASTCSCWCCFSSNYEYNCNAASPCTADPKICSLSYRVPRPRRHKNASSIRPLSLEAMLVTLVVVGILLLLPPSAVKVIVPVEGVRVSDRVMNAGERVQAPLWHSRPLDTWRGSSIPRNRRRGKGDENEKLQAGVAEAVADSYRLRGGAEGRHRRYCLWRSRDREQAEDGGPRWSEKKRSDSMRRTIELAKADAKAVRAAAQEAVQGDCTDDNNASMLILDCEVNGRRLRACIDTGAQVTVMSRACAEYCGLASRIDTGFMGKAIGVGFASILGRIHHAVIRMLAGNVENTVDRYSDLTRLDMHFSLFARMDPEVIGNANLGCSLTIIEDGGGIDLLVGLDVLRAHRCDISLSRNRMRFMAAGGWREVAFLDRVASWQKAGDDPHRGRRRFAFLTGITSRAKHSMVDRSVRQHNQDYDVKEYPETIHPRVLRELARGTRGHGIPLK